MESRPVKIWLGEIAMDEADYPLHLSMLDENERQQANNFKNDQIRRNYVVIHAQLRKLLGNAVDTPPEKLRILKAQHGKPYLAGFPNVTFNLSHTANWAALAIAYRCDIGIDIGIDIELCKARANMAALVEKCFGEEEKHYWRQLPENLKAYEFYRFWTRKEAFVKATGRGISLGLKQCTINPYCPNEFMKIPEGFGATSEWRIHDLDIKNTEAIAGALAVKSNENILIERFSFP